MIRAIFFDFYGVWVPDRFNEYLKQAEQFGPVITNDLQGVVGRYFQGKATPQEVAESFQIKLHRPDIEAEQFVLLESDIAPQVADFMRDLHGHFVKLGVLAELGVQEYKLLTDFNAHNQLFEVITGPLPLGLNVPLLSQEVFVAALQAIGEPPKSCLVITSDESYKRFAESLGIVTMPFNGLPALRETLIKLLTSETST